VRKSREKIDIQEKHQAACFIYVDRGWESSGRRPYKGEKVSRSRMRIVTIKKNTGGFQTRPYGIPRSGRFILVRKKQSGSLEVPALGKGWFTSLA
jgi:hypothetical protein